MSFTVRRLSSDRRRRGAAIGKAVVPFLNVLRPMLAIFWTWKEQKEREEEHAVRMTLLKRVCIGLVAVLCGFVVLGGVAKALLALRVVSISSIVSVTGAALPTDALGHTNILLLGQGDEDHDGKDLTDSIMIASVDPKNTRSAVLISLPRDLYLLNTENMGKGRVNSLYRDYKGLLRSKGMDELAASSASLREVAAELGRQFDMEIHHAVKVDFSAFTKAIDAIGGVDVEVAEDIVDTQYPGPNYTFETFEIKAGPQHLDGATALKYVRTRHTTSDFGRAGRQQQVLAAMVQKVKKGGLLRDPSTVASFLNIAGEHVLTTMTLRELIGLAAAGGDIDRSRILTMQVNDRNGLYGEVIEPGGFLYTPPRDLFESASVLLPVSIPEFPVTWRQLRTLRELMIDDRTPYLSRPAIHVLNAGAPSGTARKIGTELIRYGFAVERIENADIDDLAESVITGTPGHEEPTTFFSTLLGIETGPLPPDPDPKKTGDITIVLGEDATFTPLQSLVQNLTPRP